MFFHDAYHCKLVRANIPLLRIRRSLIRLICVYVTHVLGGGSSTLLTSAIIHRSDVWLSLRGRQGLLGRVVLEGSILMLLLLILVHIFIDVEMIWITTCVLAIVKRLIISTFVIPKALAVSDKLFRRGGDQNRVVCLINQRWVLWSCGSTMLVAAPLSVCQVAEAVLIVFHIPIHD